jgi:phosphate transport system permease protein
MDARKPYTGHARRRNTSRLVRVGEVLSRLCITVGGIGTIIAVGLVCVFLVWEVYPLFLPATIHEVDHLPPLQAARQPLRMAVDDYQSLGWFLHPDGTLEIVRLDNGGVLKRQPLFPGQTLTACSAPMQQPDLAFGFADGTLRLGRIRFVSGFPDPAKLPEALRDLPSGVVAEFEGGILTRTPEGQLRSNKVQVSLDDPIKPETPAAVQLLDLSTHSDNRELCVLTADGKLHVRSVSTSTEELLPGQGLKETGGELKLPQRPGRGLPSHLLLSGVGDDVFAIWANGDLVRVNTLDLEHPKVVEEANLLGQEGLRVTSVQFQIGKATLLVGDSSGRVRAWFRIKPENARTADRAQMVAAHELPGPSTAVTALATSSRTRTMAAGYADGRVRLFYITSEKYLGETWAEHEQPVQLLALAPKDDGLMALTPAGAWRWQLNPGNPEITFAALFRPVWYEGYARPEQVWQSSGGSDDVEPKFGLWPLVFGTLKATFYSLLLGVPLALLAAVFTSEFLHARTRALIKPTVEMMASLPSVVLGFLSALVLAPFVETRLTTVLAALVTVPLAFLLGAYVWQLLPQKLGLRLMRLRFLFILAVLPLGIAGALVLGPVLERLFFQGDYKAWLTGQAGGAASGWAFLLLPFSALGVLTLFSQTVNPRLRRKTAEWSRSVNTAVDLGKFLVGVGLTFAVAFPAGAILSSLGWDARGTIVGTYVQRNALVVGFMMGFAIIPIIYTIAEDALSAVPEHLRSASLGCGATPWQTAYRIIIPTAMSGLFSAVMVGLGRAVGETMIVLMAAGNTPIMDLNVFNGFRTLSANIAVELPEAVRDSTHYRTLFLAALTLFLMTFALNSVAELIRLRFRKRAYQL